MSIDVNWETFTSGPDGEALCENVRSFIHEKFQAIELPRFLRSVDVHSFEFGSVAPEIEIKDICDPLPDFYEEEEDDDDDVEERVDGINEGEWRQDPVAQEVRGLRERRRDDRMSRSNTSSISHPPPYIDTRIAGMRSSHPGELGSPFLGATTPGIPGGTSNLNYFHSQLATGLSGTQTPLAAVAGAHFHHYGWPDMSGGANGAGTMGGAKGRPMLRHNASGISMSPPSTSHEQHARKNSDSHILHTKDSVSTFAASSSSTTRPRTQDGLSEESEPTTPNSPPRRFHEPKVEDVQTVFRIKYSGDIKLSLTAEILLDYPMPSFVGIPVKLNITGLSFDGVAVVAYIRKRAHFCFLSPEDALTSTAMDDGQQVEEGGFRKGGLLQEIKVESEIGRKGDGKTSLKNVGKVEKFVLEQVRRIFEDEFVYPSFWTFLV